MLNKSVYLNTGFQRQFSNKNVEDMIKESISKDEERFLPNSH